MINLLFKMNQSDFEDAIKNLDKRSRSFLSALREAGIRLSEMIAKMKSLD